MVRKLLGRWDVSFVVVTLVALWVRRLATRTTGEAWSESLARAAAYGLVGTADRYLRRRLIQRPRPATAETQPLI